MKRLIFLVGILFAVGAEARPMELEKVLMEDLIPVPDRDGATYEIKTNKFDKVILDCGGYVGWFSFYRNEKIVHNVFLDTYNDCPNMLEYLKSSHESGLAVCLQVDGKNLTVSEEEDDCQ